MWAGVGQAVAEGWAATEEPSLGGRLCCHRASYTGPDPGPLALAHSAEERHDHVVGLGARVHASADLRNPQLNAEVLEQREREREMGAVERALRLPDNDRIEASVGGAQKLQEPLGLRPALPRKGAGLSDLEELRHDLAARRFDELHGATELPGA